MTRILFISKGEDSASTRYRALDFFPYFTAAGYQPEHASAERKDPISRLRLLNAARKAQVVVVLRKGFAGYYAHLLRKAAKVLVFDLDDAIFNATDGSESPMRYRRFSRMAGLSDLVWAGNEFLAGHVRRFNERVVVLPTSLDAGKYDMDPPKPADTFDLVWIGSHSTRKYLQLALPALEAAALKWPQLRLKIVADFDLETRHLVTVPIAWSQAGEALALASSHVGIAPMVEDPWTQGKCALKVIQYMAAGLPVISSPAGANREVVEAGVSGLLAADDAEWVQAIQNLMVDPGLRQAMGEAGRRRARERYSLEGTFARMRASLEQVVR